MTTGAPSIADAIPVDVAGQVEELAASQIAGAFPTLSTITPTAPFNFNWNGSILQFNTGDTVPVRADVLAAITAAGAPFTTP